MSDIALENMPTADIQSEISKREGVVTYIVPPHKEASIVTPDGTKIAARGPCTVTVNND